MLHKSKAPKDGGGLAPSSSLNDQNGYKLEQSTSVCSYAVHLSVCSVLYPYHWLNLAAIESFCVV